MRVLSVLLACAAAGFTAARSPQHVGHNIARNLPEPPRARRSPPGRPQHVSRSSQNTTLIPQNDNTTKYAVDGTALPDVDFDVGESYAGLMPTGLGEDRSLYFWFFPTHNIEGQEEVTIWLNGGPGCSSLEGFLQENGPVIWQYGTFKPVSNPWTWVNLTNMVWVEQPVGTGFSQGRPTATNEEEVAKEFLGFFKNFIDTFSLQNKKIYVTGESYAGYYVPYIADAMLNEDNTDYFDVQGTLIYDPVIGEDTLQTNAVAVPFVDKWSGLFNFNETFMKHLHDKHASCGYEEYLDKYLTYPPPGPFEEPPKLRGGCGLFNQVAEAAFLTNPCFDYYQIATTCPLLWDVLGFPGSFDYLPEGAEVYFNRTEVQKAINAPIQEWATCQNGVLVRDTSSPVTLSVYPGVIERSKRTVLAHASLDFVLIEQGSRLAIQNMTWGGKQGFQKEPKDAFYVPYHSELSDSTLAYSGEMGVTTTERGFTYVETFLSGHMVPQYAPSAAYRHMEYLLGRIDSLTEVSDFTTQQGKFN